jgi:poly(beta-D-mannuronate) lyase
MNCTLHQALRIGLIILLAVAAAASEKTVSTAAELEAAVGSAKPGDSILLRDGTWKDVRIVLNTAGSAAAPITLHAQTPGKVILAGASNLTFSAPYVAAEGLLFRDGAIAKGSVITFQSDHCRLANSAIVNYNPPELTTAYYWVYFAGSDNLVERTLFEAKNHMGPLVGNAIKDARRNTVEKCYFKDIGSSHGRNGMEIFRIWGYGGNEELGEDGAFFTIEGNLFERADGESMEIISLKSNRNRVLHNTIRATLGGITNRSGNFNTIAGNIILCEGRKGAYGMRITGQHQRIEDNFISGCDYGIMLVSGEYIERDVTGKYDPIKREGTPLGRVPRYGWVRETDVLHNTFVDNTGTDLMIGGNYKSGWPGSQRFLFPEDNAISGNVIIKSGGGTAVDAAALDTNPPLDAFHFKPNRFAENMIFGGDIRITPVPIGLVGKNPKLRPSPAPHMPLRAGDVGPSFQR